MLSQDLRALAVWFDACLEGTHEFTVDGAKNFSKAIRVCIEQAKDLEEQAAPPPARMGLALSDDNVVPFPVTPRRPPSRMPEPRGGDAA